MPKVSKANLVSAQPGDWVIHAAGSPQNVYAVGPTIKDLQRQLEEKGIAVEAVEVYQVPADETHGWVGGGELQFLLH